MRRVGSLVNGLVLLAAMALIAYAGWLIVPWLGYLLAGLQLWVLAAAMSRPAGRP